MKSKLLSGVLAAAVAALVGVPAVAAAAQPASQLWTIVVHFEYADGFNYDYPLRTGVPTSEVPGYLADCGRAHQQPSVVLFRCFPIPE
ncbi:MAG TPA: hypothetical protein VFK57_11590 [Vicinamibacterales bacterium]|nr:hypothetical protein [Vicinamibacterales bacterium]